MMNTCSTDEKRMQKILDIYLNEYDLMIDAKFNYTIEVEKYFLMKDISFFVNLLQIVDMKMIKNHTTSQVLPFHLKELLESDKYLKFRKLIGKHLKYMFNVALRYDINMLD